MLQGWTRTSVGNVRTRNEDACWLSNMGDWHLALVADGMGGHQGGEVASSTAVGMISDMILDWASACGDKGWHGAGTVLCDAVEAANGAIYKLGQKRADLTGMGTTVTAALFSQNGVHIAHVGDSRAYLFRADKLIQLTEDHSVVQGMVNCGSISAGEARTHPSRNLLTRAVGTHEHILVDQISLPVESGDAVLLCTDGLTAELPDVQIERIMRATGPDRIASALLEAALAQGGHDNITAVLVLCI